MSIFTSKFTNAKSFVFANFLINLFEKCNPAVGEATEKPSSENSLLYFFLFSGSSLIYGGKGRIPYLLIKSFTFLSNLQVKESSSFFSTRKLKSFVLYNLSIFFLSDDLIKHTAV